MRKLQILRRENIYEGKRYKSESVKPEKDVHGSVRHEEEIFKLVLLHEIQKVILHAPPPHFLGFPRS